MQKKEEKKREDEKITDEFTSVIRSMFLNGNIVVVSFFAAQKIIEYNKHLPRSFCSMSGAAEGR
mgnify:CR=1 FL=1